MGTSEVVRPPAEKKLIVATRSSMHALDRFWDECGGWFEDPRGVEEHVASFRRDRVTSVLGLDEWRGILAGMPRDSEEELEVQADQYTGLVRSAPVHGRGILLGKIYTSRAGIVDVSYRERVQNRRLVKPEEFDIRDITQTKGNRRQVALTLQPEGYTVKAEYMSPDGKGGRHAVFLMGEFYDEPTGEITEANVTITRKQYLVEKLPK